MCKVLLTFNIVALPGSAIISRSRSNTGSKVKQLNFEIHVYMRVDEDIE